MRYLISIQCTLYTRDTESQQQQQQQQSRLRCVLVCSAKKPLPKKKKTVKNRLSVRVENKNKLTEPSRCVQKCFPVDFVDF